MKFGPDLRFIDENMEEGRRIGPEPQQYDCREVSADPVNPSHYQGQFQWIDAIQDALSEEEFKGYLKGQVLKYVRREGQKNGTEDLKKAQWYLTKLIEESA